MQCDIDTSHFLVALRNSYIYIYSPQLPKYYSKKFCSKVTSTILIQAWLFPPFLGDSYFFWLPSFLNLDYIHVCNSFMQE
jgi:hypothetical protein